MCIHLTEEKMKLISNENDKIVVEFSRMEFMQIHSTAYAAYADYEEIEYENLKMERSEIAKLKSDLDEIFDNIFD
jgi:hypothetical protein